MFKSLSALRFASLALAGATLSPVAVAAPKPNIIFVISDDHRWDCIGAAGNPNIHTPHIDKLAAEGVYFTQATIHIPQCSPSRAALLTGQASSANGRYSNQSARADTWNADGYKGKLCTPEALAAQGYLTANVGKWHLPHRPWNVGFEKTGVWMPGALGPYKNAPLAEGRSFDSKPHPDFTQTAFGDSAREIIRTHAADATTRPLFLWIAYTAPHSPYKPNPPSATKPYEGKKIQDVVPPGYKGDITQPDAKRWLDYVAAITSVDEEVGKLRQTLDQSGMSSNTVIVFLGDNGYMMGSRGMNGKGYPWEESIRVPLIVWGPGVFSAKGKTTAAASSLDLPATFVKLAGGTAPPDWHGRDLTQVLDNLDESSTTFSITEVPDYRNHKFPDMAYRALRTSTTKLIVWHPKVGKSPELYNLAKDPYETRNLYAEASEKDTVTRLESTLANWMKQTGDDWKMHGEWMPTGLGNATTAGLERAKNLEP